MLGVVFDQRLTFHKHVSAVARSCITMHMSSFTFVTYWLRNLHSHWPEPLACSLILSMIDYCNAVLRGTPSCSIKKLQQCKTMQLGSFSRRQDDPMPACCWGRCTGCPFSRQLTTKWLLTFKICNTSTPSHLPRFIQDQQHGCNLRSATTTLCQPYTTTTFVKHAFRWCLELTTDYCHQ